MILKRFSSIPDQARYYSKLVFTLSLLQKLCNYLRYWMYTNFKSNSSQIMHNLIVTVLVVDVESCRNIFTVWVCTRFNQRSPSIIVQLFSSCINKCQNNELQPSCIRNETTTANLTNTWGVSSNAIGLTVEEHLQLSAMSQLDASQYPATSARDWCNKAVKSRTNAYFMMRTCIQLNNHYLNSVIHFALYGTSTLNMLIRIKNHSSWLVFP